MGSQWAGMIEGLLQLDPFAKAINRAANILKTEGLDLLSVLNSKDETTFDNVLNSFVSITSMQVILFAKNNIYVYITPNNQQFRIKLLLLVGQYKFVQILKATIHI